MEENKKGKNTAIKVILILVGIVVFTAIGTYFANDRLERNKLIQEIQRVSTVDITKKKINEDNIKSKGKYAKIEKLVKSYLNGYASILQETLGVLGEEQLENVLSVDNLKEDGPDFVKTKQYLKEVKEKYAQCVEKLSDQFNEESISNYEGAKELSSSEFDLYKKLLIGNNAGGKLEEAKQKLDKVMKANGTILDTKEEIINFLSENKGNWQIQGSRVMFTNQTLLKQYNAYIKSMQDEIKAAK